MPQNIHFSKNMCLIKAVGINKYAYDITYEMFAERFREIVLKLTIRVNICNVFVIGSTVQASEIVMPSRGCFSYLQLA
jgi:hypothetical protein